MTAIAADAEVDSAVEAIQKQIDIAKSNNHRLVKIRQFDFGEGYIYLGQLTDTQKRIIDQLVASGFQAKTDSFCGQFVDCWLEVRW